MTHNSVSYVMESARTFIILRQDKKNQDDYFKNSFSSDAHERIVLTNSLLQNQKYYIMIDDALNGKYRSDYNFKFIGVSVLNKESYSGGFQLYGHVQT